MKLIKSISILFVTVLAVFAMTLPAFANDEAADAATTEAEAGTEVPPVDAGPGDEAGQDAEEATPDE